MTPVQPLSWSDRAFWVLGAFVPSSYLLGVTQHLTTDVAAVPLLWVVPLVLYLATFILAFANLAPLRSLSRLLPILMLGLAVALALSAKRPAWVVAILHLLTFFGSAWLVHGRLWASRPPAQSLTEFYLLLALGGVLGGLFNALAAPVLFRTVAEYPLAIFAVALFRPSSGGRPARPIDRAMDVGLGVGLMLTLVLGFEAGLRFLGRAPLERLGLSPDQVAVILVIGVPAVVAYLLSGRSLRFALALGVMLWLGHTQSGPSGRVVYVERTFFGVYRVTEEGGIRRLIHGTTEHGAQALNPADAAVPLTYYHPLGPIGQAFKTLGERVGDRVGLVGMGTGALAAYVTPGRHFTFFEIDPAVVRIAEDPALFTYLLEARSRGGRCDIVLGDGRLSLRDTDAEFGFLVLDAFTSDAIPVHLLTREAFELYLRRLRRGSATGQGGVLAVHVSNQYLDLGPVVGAIARHLGLAALDFHDPVSRQEQDRTGRSTSRWIFLARDAADLSPLMQDERCSPLNVPRDAPLWTDDFSNILGVMRWD